MNTPSFHALRVPAPVIELLDAAGIVTPSPIQLAVIPDGLAGRDVIGRAPTGSGKTLAFGIPLLARLDRAQRRRPTGLVLAPTRELAEQIARELTPLAHALSRRVVSVYGGVGYGAQRRAFDQGVDLVVACPGRLEDLLAAGALRLDDVGVVVVDEADRMADMGFLPAVERIVGQTGADRQTSVFSATLDGAVGKLSRSLQHDPVRHEVGPSGTDVSKARHVFWELEPTERIDWVGHVAQRLGATVVFCRTRRGADRLAKRLATSGVTAAAIHGGRSQAQRDRALADFAQGRVRALIATDVAARGVHVDGVEAVVHFDPPEDHATYIHRSGRTARAGASGVVVSMWAPGSRRAVQTLQRGAGLDVELGAPDLTTLGDPKVAPERLETKRAETKRTETKRTDATRAETRRTPRERRTGRPAFEQVAPVHARTDAALTGTIVSYNAGKGFGFIDAGQGKDLFVHHSNLTANLTSKVRPGQRVRFEVREGRRGPEAVAVAAL